MKKKLVELKKIIEEVLELLDLEKIESLDSKKDAPPACTKFDLVHKEFELLKKILESEAWPEAVFSAQIADENSEEDKAERAQGISDIMLPPVFKKKFLDFGCGEGHLAELLSKEADVSVGYDITSSNSKLKWEEQNEKFLLTTDFSKVVQMGPFDVILLYDVLDHVENESPAEILSRASSVLAEEGKIYVRCHPWCGRHGGHAYRKLNKAFVHLVFSEEELRSLGVDINKNIKVIKPLLTYGNFIKEAGLSQDCEPEIDNSMVEDFFKETPLVRQRLLKIWGANEWSSDPPEFQMSQSFVDYVLKK